MQSKVYVTDRRKSDEYVSHFLPKGDTKKLVLLTNIFIYLIGQYTRRTKPIIIINNLHGSPQIKCFFLWYQFVSV